MKKKISIKVILNIVLILFLVSLFAYLCFSDNGLLDLTFTGVGSNEYGDWYFKDGTIAFDYSGTISFGGQDYTVTNGYAVKA